MGFVANLLAIEKRNSVKRRYPAGTVFRPYFKKSPFAVIEICTITQS